VVGLGLLPPGDTPVAANALITRELRLVGCFRFDTERGEVLRALSDGRLPADPVVTSVLPVSRTDEAFQLAAEPARSCKVLLDFGDPAGA
jgi:L-idonate 5-dehydrogenase